MPGSVASASLPGVSVGPSPASSIRGIFFSKVGTLLGAAGLVFSCGARGLVVEEELLDGPDGSGGTRSATGMGGGGGATSSEPPFRFEETQLQECVLGFVWSASSDRACNFRFNNRCYDGEREVCACACPRTTSSTCVLSGFLSDPDNPLTVACQPRRR